MTELFSTIWDWFWGVMSQYLPAAYFPADVESSLVAISGWLGYLAAIFPVYTLLTLAGLSIIFELVLLTFAAVRAIANFLRGSGA